MTDPKPGFVVRVGDRQVRLDSYSPAAWSRIEEAGPHSWADVFRAPVIHIGQAYAVVREGIAILEPDVDPAARTAELTPTIEDLYDLIQLVGVPGADRHLHDLLLGTEEPTTED